MANQDRDNQGKQQNQQNQQNPQDSGRQKGQSDDTPQQGQQGNIKQNTTNQGKSARPMRSSGDVDIYQDAEEHTPGRSGRLSRERESTLGNQETAARYWPPQT